jgi:hypothetical protein
MTVAPPSNIPISVDYTGRDYYSLRDELIARIQDRIPEWNASDPADFGVALVEAFAYMGDLVSYYIDRVANESFIRTATQRESLLNIALTYGYTPAGYRNATVGITFTNSSEDEVTIPTGTVVSGQVIIDDTVETVYFTTVADAVIDALVGETPGEYTVSASEGRSVTLIADETTTYGELVGTSTGTPAMRFVLGESPVVDGSVEVYVQDGDLFSKWTQVEHIIDYSTNDLVYSLFIDDNNLVYINFGDGVSGVIPTNYSEIRALYTVGGGSIGNIESAVIDTIEFIPNLSEGETTAVQGAVTVTNETAALGGSDPETNDQIRASAPAALRSGNRAVTLKDFSDLALSVSGVGKANATAAVWTSVTLYIAPSRSATDTDLAPGLDDADDPTAEFERIQASVEEFLTDKVLIGTTVTVQPPTYVDLLCTLAYTKTDQYTTAEVVENIKIAILTGFGYVNATFAETIYPRDVEFMVLQAPGVKTVNVTALHLTGGSGANTMVGTAGQIWRFQEANLNIGVIA